MNTRVPPTEGEIPVVCVVCQTRSFATADQIGQQIKCPDCDSLNRVKALEKSVPRAPQYTGDEYRLSDDVPRREPAKDLIKVVCGTCYTLMYARAGHVGKRVKCPDCGAISVVPRPPKKKPAFQAPDASDINVEAVPPPLVDEKRKEIADRLMAGATDDSQRRAAELPEPPKDPLRDGIYNFPFYANVIPLWVGAAGAILLDAKLVVMLIELAQQDGLGSIAAIFLGPVVTIFSVVIAGFLAPHLLTIIEFTADGYNKIPYWDTHDTLSRGRAILFGINAVAMSTLPGMLLVGPMRPLGVPTPLALISTVLLLPLVILAMAENDSVFAPYSKFVFGSVRRLADQWSRFYIQSILLALAILAVDYLLWTSFSGNVVAAVFAVVSLCLYFVIYFRLVGRMAWVLGQDEVVDEEDEDEEDDDEDEEEEAHAKPQSRQGL